MTRRARFFFALTLPLSALLLGVYEALDGESLRCPFYSLTGLYCPGCGSGRAVRALLRGRVFEAFGLNPLLFLLGIPAGYVLVHEYLRLAFPSLGLRAVALSRRVCAGCVILVFAFWLLRNLPMFAFLAPAGGR